MSHPSRREILKHSAALGGVALLAGRAGAHPGHAAVTVATPTRAPTGWRDDGHVITPNGARAPWREVGGVKVFHLVAEMIEHEIAPGLTIHAMGYSGRSPGPTIEVREGDRCRFYVTNKLPEATSVHWHGVFVPNGMDGVAGLTQPGIAPDETYVYDFTFDHAGTFMYHPHSDEMVQIALGMMGMIVVHPRGGPDRRVRDHALMLHEWKIVAGTRRPDPLAMNDFNVLTFNGKAFPATEPLVAELGDRVRLRLGNLGPMDHHPIHLHGHAMKVVATDGGAVPVTAQVPETTVLVPTGTVRVAELTASAPGDWPIHCHMTHHTMNQMGHELPNLIGADVRRADAKLRQVLPRFMTMGEAGMGGMAEMGMPGPDGSIPMSGAPGPHGTIDMGGMFTMLKIRKQLGAGDPGWYEQPAGSAARVASAAELLHDGIDVDQ